MLIKEPLEVADEIERPAEVEGDALRRAALGEPVPHLHASLGFGKAITGGYLY